MAEPYGDVKQREEKRAVNRTSEGSSMGRGWSHQEERHKFIKGVKVVGNRKEEFEKKHKTAVA